jgi:hypothetical protein
MQLTTETIEKTLYEALISHSKTEGITPQATGFNISFDKIGELVYDLMNGHDYIKQLSLQEALNMDAFIYMPLSPVIKKKFSESVDRLITKREVEPHNMNLRIYMGEENHLRVFLYNRDKGEPIKVDEFIN